MEAPIEHVYVLQLKLSELASLSVSESGTVDRQLLGQRPILEKASSRRHGVSNLKELAPKTSPAPRKFVIGWRWRWLTVGMDLLAVARVWNPGGETGAGLMT